MNTGFIMLPRELKTKMKGLNPFDKALLLEIIMNCIYIEQYEHKGLILNKGEWQRSYSQLQLDLSYIENQKEIVPTIAQIRASIKRLQQQSFLGFHDRPQNRTYNTVLKLHESLVLLLFPASEKKPTTEPTTEPTTKKIENLQQQNNNVLNINNNVLKKKELKNNNINLPSVNKLDSRPNFYDTFLLAYGRMPSPIQIQDILTYLEEGMEEELICHAIQISAKATTSVAYLWGVLRNWTRDGIKTLQSAMTVKKTKQGQVDESEESRRKRSIEEFGW